MILLMYTSADWNGTCGDMSVKSFLSSLYTFLCRTIPFDPSQEIPWNFVLFSILFLLFKPRNMARSDDHHISCILGCWELEIEMVEDGNRPMRLSSRLMPADEGVH